MQTQYTICAVFQTEQVHMIWKPVQWPKTFTDLLLAVHLLQSEPLQTCEECW